MIYAIVFRGGSRIFERGGLLAPGGGGGKALLVPPGSAPDYLGEQFFVGRGGRPPCPPPLDPRLSVYAVCVCAMYRPI